MSVSLRTYSTIKIGGSAEKIIFLKDLTDTILLPKPIRILGNGSNILIDDRGLKGTVIICRDFSPTEPVILTDHLSETIVSASSGTYLPTLAAWAAKNGLSGCEYMVGVPGTLGGAVLQNAGANEQEISHILVSVKALNIATGTFEVFSAEECGLTYRHSALKNRPELLVKEVTLKLKKADSAAIQNQTNLNLQYRKSKTPYSKPSLGSVFTRLKENDTWIYPGKLIEDSGLKGVSSGAAMVSPVHANYIVNEGGASFLDVLQLIKKVETTVLEKTGKKLEREILIWTDLAE